LDTGSIEVLDAFGMVLRELRQRKGWSQEALAFESQTDRTYVSLLELGKNSASVTMVFKLCAALGISPADFMQMVQNRIDERRKKK
jgi:transcriptional regulator with XRE-family HTH domain